ncbi:NUDIX domain-containing protein [Litorihabitans aurantiacus]|uniref:8-oxo-dGTP diphosphatase n=1 Tax=Litorihabitans aurantiacus TaxID=1930061 RepID=A0AA37XGY2_9MICO|nr:NUDIX domain-containing protein [Litorihabitans aurantiacus]GMA33286.1 DNA mismatch repair protein MutT [Litorihabitans aurantiacus]
MSVVHRVVAGALVDERGVLLLHRDAGRTFYPGCWDLPGGHVEPGEEPARALVRELREEVGVIADVAGDADLHVVDASGPEEMDLRMWVVRSWSGQPANLAPDEHDDLRWVGPGQWQGLDLAHPSVAELLRAVLHG